MTSAMTSRRDEIIRLRKEGQKSTGVGTRGDRRFRREDIDDFLAEVGSAASSSA